MADTVLNTTVFDGAKKLITHYNVVSDSSGSTTKIVDVSELNSNNGKTCKTVRLNKVSFNVSVTAPVDAIRMQWDATTDVVFQTLALGRSEENRDKPGYTAIEKLLKFCLNPS